jgi:Flp pilus assembly protein TadB
VTFPFPFAYACLGLLAAAIDASQAFWGASDDPTWETRWRSLDPAERTWLAAMATSRKWLATLTDPEEIKLAKGQRRHESRRRLYFDLAFLPLLLAVTVLVLAGALSAASILMIVFPGYVLVRSFWVYRREQQIKGALEDQRKLAAATTA